MQGVKRLEPKNHYLLMDDQSEDSYQIHLPSKTADLFGTRYPIEKDNGSYLWITELDPQKTRYEEEREEEP